MAGHGPAELPIEFGQLSRYIGGSDARQITNLDVVVFESGLTSEPSHQFRIWRDEPPHDVELPAASDLDRQWLPPDGFVPDPAKNLGQVATEPGRVGVPVSH